MEETRLIKAIIKDLPSVLPKENIDEVIEEAEQFLREVE